MFLWYTTVGIKEVGRNFFQVVWRRDPGPHKWQTAKQNCPVWQDKGCRACGGNGKEAQGRGRDLENVEAGLLRDVNEVPTDNGTHFTPLHLHYTDSLGYQGLLRYLGIFTMGKHFSLTVLFSVNYVTYSVLYYKIDIVLLCNLAQL